MRGPCADRAIRFDVIELVPSPRRHLSGAVAGQRTLGE
jgi:hypothetical protein